MHRELLIACLPYLGGIAASVLVCRLLIALSGANFERAQLRRLHRDERGAVQSLSFVLTLPLFVMLMLFIVQLSQLTIARVVVEYSAFAAARAAVVWIPARTGHELENQVGDQPLEWIAYETDENGVEYDCYAVSPGSLKYEEMRLAAAMALMSICPSRDNVAQGSDPGNGALDSIQRAYLALSPDAFQNTRVAARLQNKLAYALESTSLEIEVRHPVYRDGRLWEPPLQHYDIRPYVDEFAANEIGWQDQLHITVVHDFALLPGPGRLLAQPATRPRDEVSERIRRRNNTYVYPMTATVVLNNEGEKPLLPYTQPAVTRDWSGPPGNQDEDGGSNEI